MSASSPRAAVPAITFVLGAAAGYFGYALVDSSDAEPVRGPAAESSAGDTAADPEIAALRSEIEALRAKNDELEAMAERKVVEAASIGTGGQPAGGAEATEIPFEVLDAGGVAHLLGGVDWKLIGQTHKDMLPLLAKLAEALENGEEVPLELHAEIQRLNAGLVAQASRILDADVAGHGVNGAYTHPSVVGNQVVATLAAAGMQLDDAQRNRLTDLMNRYGAVDKGVRDDASMHEFALETVMAEADYKSEFYDELEGMLTTEQMAILTNPSVRNRARLSIFGEALMFPDAHGIPVEGRDGMATAWTRRVADATGVGGDELRAVVREWVDGFPSNYFDESADALEHMGMIRADRIRQAGSRQVELMRAVIARFGDRMSPEQRAAFVRETQVFVPLPR